MNMRTGAYFLLAVVLVAHVHAASIDKFKSVLARAQARSRSEWHTSSGAATETAHEKICTAALASVPNHATLFSEKFMHWGVSWNDMPNGADTDPLAERVAVGHLATTDFVAGHIQHLAQSTDLLYETHYGCLQHWHGMAPVVVTQTTKAQAGNPAPLTAATRMVFRNSDVKEFIMAQMKMWWSDFVDAADTAKNALSPSASASAFLPKRTKAEHEAQLLTEFRSWTLGHMLHTIQDSYAAGHTVRQGLSPVSPNRQLIANFQDATATCGLIVTFQGYDAQDDVAGKHGHGSHWDADFSPLAQGSRVAGTKMSPVATVDLVPDLQARWACSVRKSNDLLKAAAACLTSHSVAACDFDTSVKPILDGVFGLARGAGARTAGGSLAAYARTAITAGTDITFAAEQVNGQTLYNPTSQNFWSAAAPGTKLCGPTALRATLAKPGVAMGFAGLKKGAFTHFYNPSVPAPVAAAPPLTRSPSTSSGRPAQPKAPLRRTQSFSK